jgi:predicted glutamine amidotransferase
MEQHNNYDYVRNLDEKETRKVAEYAKGNTEGTISSSGPVFESRPGEILFAPRNHMATSFGTELDKGYRPCG